MRAPLWLWILYGIALIPALLVTGIISLLKGASQFVRRAFTSSHAATRKAFKTVCVDPYCKAKGKCSRR